MKVSIVGASGETGQSIANGLLSSQESWDITAFVRPSSIDKPQIQRLQVQNVRVVPLDLDAPHAELVEALRGQDIVISCVIPFTAQTQIALADAAKAAGVSRFVPSAFGPACPAEGVLILRTIKETVARHIQKIYLPYTSIDVGWWYQNSVPRLPSGRIDYAVRFPMNTITGDGNLPTALTDIRDIGRYVARIIADPRTLNKSVFAYNEVLTQEQIFATLEDVSGESITRAYQSREEIEESIKGAEARYKEDASVPNLLGLSTTQYSNSIWLRGDNLPKSAAYLGYLDGKELYPDLSFVKFADYVKELVEGKGKGVYMDRVFGFEKDVLKT